MKKDKQTEGKKGEDIAVNYLRRLGFKIIERNYLIRGGEIDIVCIDASETPETLVFVEVKARRSSKYGTPLEAITPWKLRSLIRAAEVYKMKHPRLPDAMRIDAVAIVLDYQDNIVELELVKNIS